MLRLDIPKGLCDSAIKLIGNMELLDEVVNKMDLKTVVYGMLEQEMEHVRKMLSRKASRRKGNMCKEESYSCENKTKCIMAYQIISDTVCS